MARVITVTGGRAGVGKTSICVQLAAQLAGRGQRVCLLDADGSGVNAGELLGLEPGHTLKDLVLYGVALDELLMHSCRGFDVLPGGSSADWMQALTSAQLHQLTASLRQLDGYDFLLIDSAITAAHNALSIAQTSPEVILVITPSAISVADTYSLLNLLFSEHPTKRIQVVVNKVDNHIVGRHSYGGYREVAGRYLGRQLPLLGLVGEDPQIQAGLLKQQAPGNGQAAAVARDIDGLAGQLLAEKIVLPERNMQRFCDRYFKAVAVKDAGQTAAADLLEIPLSRKQNLQREVEYLSSQVDDLIREIERLRQPPEGTQRAPLPETPIAALASDSQAVTVQGETFSIYSMQSSDGGRQYFAWHSLDDAVEASQPRAKESD